MSRPGVWDGGASKRKVKSGQWSVLGAGKRLMIRLRFLKDRAETDKTLCVSVE